MRSCAIQEISAMEALLLHVGVSLLWVRDVDRGDSNLVELLLDVFSLFFLFSNVMVNH